MDHWGRNIVTPKKFTTANPEEAVDSQAVLRELFELLEDYAPAWYTETHHNRVVAALGELVA
jgi:hypothetical protein